MSENGLMNCPITECRIVCAEACVLFYIDSGEHITTCLFRGLKGCQKIFEELVPLTQQIISCTGDL